MEVTLGDMGKALCHGCQRQGRPKAAPQELPISLCAQVHPASAGPSGTQATEGMGVGTVFAEPKGRGTPGICQNPPDKVAFLARNSLQEQSLPLSYIKHRQCFMST